MTSDRPYHLNKKGRPPEEAFAEVERQAGRQFDPDCARAFLDIRSVIVETMYDLMPDTKKQQKLTSIEPTPAAGTPAPVIG